MCKLIIVGSKKESSITYNTATNIFVLLRETRPDLIITNMLPGIGQSIAKEAYRRSIPFVAALAFKNIDLGWQPKTRQKYRWLLSKALDIVYVDRQIGYISEVVPPDIYHKDKLTTCQQWMKDQREAGDTIYHSCLNERLTPC